MAEAIDRDERHARLECDRDDGFALEHPPLLDGFVRLEPAGYVSCNSRVVIVATASTVRLTARVRAARMHVWRGFGTFFCVCYTRVLLCLRAYMPAMPSRTTPTLSFFSRAFDMTLPFAGR